MDYENKYKQALSRATFYNNELLTENQRKMLLDIFPELTMSEDERIRKALIEMIHDTTGDECEDCYHVSKESVLAWLEKQGEKKTEMIDKACEWLEQHLHHDNVGGFWADATSVEEFINQFKSGCSEIPNNQKGGGL